MTASTNPPLTQSEITLRHLRRVMAVFTGLLVLSTWPLWVPGGEFPDIPWTQFAPPAWFDWVSLTSLVILFALQFAPLPHHRDWPGIVQAMLFATACWGLLSDQHRFQPWVWQMMVSAIIIGFPSKARWRMNCLRGFVISIYFWSAISRMDRAFFDTQGRWLLEGLDWCSRSLDGSVERDHSDGHGGFIPCMGVDDSSTARFFAAPADTDCGWPWSCMGCCCLHSDHWGHDQWPAVLLWNVYFIVQAFLLFGRSSQIVESQEKFHSLTGEEKWENATVRVVDGHRLPVYRRCQRGVTGTTGRVGPCTHRAPQS